MQTHICFDLLQALGQEVRGTYTSRDAFFNFAEREMTARNSRKSLESETSANAFTLNTDQAELTMPRLIFAFS